MAMFGRYTPHVLGRCMVTAVRDKSVSVHGDACIGNLEAATQGGSRRRT